jgi:drug/metabolite transporter (DMT)-like permease
MTLWQGGLVVVLSVVQMAIPYMMFSWALKHVEAHHAALIVLLETVLNPVLTYLVVGEPIPRPTLLGGPVILISVVVFMILGWRREVEARRRGAT